MKVFLLRLDDRRHAFYSEGPEDVETEGRHPPHGRLRSWLEGKLHGWRAAILGADGGVAGFLRRVWEWLQRFVGPDEPLLLGLRKAQVVHLHHPPSLSPDAARRAWFDYLRGRQVHHFVWLTVNGLLCPVTALLAPLPGPNIVGYWFVYRAACHALALVGVRRARLRRVETRLVPTGPLDLALATADARAVAGLAEHCGLSGLEVYLVRIGAGAGNGSSAGLAPDTREAPTARRGA